MYTLDQLHRQPPARLAPGGVGERFIAKTVHRRAGDIPMGNLLREQLQRLAGRQRRLTEYASIRAGKLIDFLRRQ
jgi:hypothetical protein